MLRILLVICLFIPAELFAAKVELVGFHVFPAAKSTKIIYTLSKKTHGTIKYLPALRTVTVELANTQQSFPLKKMTFNHANVQSYKTEQTDKLLRFIFIVTNEVAYHAQLKTKPNHATVELELEINSLEPIIKKTKISPTKSKPAPSQFHAALRQEILKNLNSFSIKEQHDVLKERSVVGKTKFTHIISKSSAKLFTVVIDPGHGGKDSGALGQTGVQEKNVVLQISKYLYELINQQSNMRAILTRNNDSFIPLRTRLAIARKHEADLFIAIHADAYFNRYAKGASIYALSQRGATSEAARWLARQDNYSELGDVEFKELLDRSLVLRSVLIDLAQTATIRDSVSLGNKVLDQLEDITSLHYSHVEQAPFVVLKSPDIPSILVETGFISNAHEEKKLANAVYQQQLALAILQGIQKYLSSISTNKS